MSATAELFEQTQRVEVYAQSLSAITRLGESVVADNVTVDFLIERPEYVEAFCDFETAIAEHLSTDKEYGDRLIFSRPREYIMYDGRVRTATGEPVVELVENGMKASRIASEADHEHYSQYVRDVGDVMIAQQVDSLEVGEVLHAVSMDPKEDLRKNPEKWQSLGYRPGMAVVQVYYRADESRLLTYTTCIKNSDKSAIAKIYNNLYDVEIDPNQSSNTWIRNFAKQSVTEEYAEAIGANILKDHQMIIGDSATYKSTTEFVGQKADILKEYFDIYICPLAEATVTGENNKTMQSLAQQLLRSVNNLTAESRSMLIKIGNRTKFDDDNSRFMEQMIRYAATADLKELLPGFLQQNSVQSESVEQEPVKFISQSESTKLTTAQQTLSEMNQRLAMNTNRAAKNNDNWGGCSSSSSKTQVMDGAVGELDSQDIFGGKSEDSSGTQEDCEFVSKECPTCHAKNVKTTCKDGVYYGECGCDSKSGKSTKKPVSEKIKKVEYDKLLFAA